MHSPDDSACWAGEWRKVDPMVDLWANSAMLRTVDALPRLHPWRLGDDKGTHRSLLWCGSTDLNPDAVAILTQTAPEPTLPLGDTRGESSELLDGLTGTHSSVLWSGNLLSSLVSELPRPVADTVADAVADRVVDTAGPTTTPDTPKAYRTPMPGVHRWVGAVARLEGAWLPPLAVLPRSRRGFDDPGTGWQTESVDFDLRHTVHAEDDRFAADMLAPHVMALILEYMPPDAAVTIAGDAIHVWWEYDETSRHAMGKVARTTDVTARLREAIPSFVLHDFPDHSQDVEDRLAQRAAQAAEYRAKRRAGVNSDPTLQRIYAQARAAYEAESDT
jgi:hypothetical protein